ncbi:hypothetical protein RRF57_010447 [Xylaria bambusicola]|uniref:Uncharacterized protein n=1 Tax=Xylaria bambusicola TaxID=326684 RepID=A0AAN7UV09_9PEZI
MNTWDGRWTTEWIRGSRRRGRKIRRINDRRYRRLRTLRSRTLFCGPVGDSAELVWLGISSRLFRGFPVFVKAYDWTSGAIADRRRSRKFGTTVAEPHAGRLTNIVTAYLDSVFPRHVLGGSRRFGGFISRVVGVS